tara:strand:+ start:3967 stop:4359 length:393 start_codon:yes stop_codon:yes gene_type:complete
MAKFLSFNIVNTLSAATLLTEGPVLVNVDLIRSVSYVAATGVLTLGLSATATSAVAFLIKNVTTGVAAIPAITSGTPVIQAVNRAMTANPGGIKAGVTLGKDQTGGVPPAGQAPLATNLQMYAATVTFTA